MILIKQRDAEEMGMDTRSPVTASGVLVPVLVYNLSPVAAGSSCTRTLTIIYLCSVSTGPYWHDHFEQQLMMILMIRSLM